MKKQKSVQVAVVRETVKTGLQTDINHLISEFYDEKDYCKNIASTLQKNGFHLEKKNLKHILVHEIYFMYNVKNGGLLTSRPEANYITYVYEIGSIWNSCGPKQNRRKAVQTLQQTTQDYLERNRSPYTALTYKQAYHRVKKVFEDLGCRVERLEKK